MTRDTDDEPDEDDARRQRLVRDFLREEHRRQVLQVDTAVRASHSFPTSWRQPKYYYTLAHEFDRTAICQGCRNTVPLQTLDFHSPTCGTGTVVCFVQAVCSHCTNGVMPHLIADVGRMRQSGRHHELARYKLCFDPRVISRAYEEFSDRIIYRYLIPAEARQAIKDCNREAWLAVPHQIVHAILSDMNFEFHEGLLVPVYEHYSEVFYAPAPARD